MAALIFVTEVLPSLFTILITLSYIFWAPYKRLSMFPGPSLAGLSRLYSVKAFLSGKEHELMLDAHKRFGAVIRWQPNLLLCNDPRLLPDIYHHRADKTPHYNSSIDDVESIVESKDWQMHRNARHRIAETFRLDAIRTDEIILDSAIKTWICELTNRFAVTGQIFEFTNWPILIAADANMIRLMGWSYSQIPSGYEEALNLIKTMQGGVKAMHTLGRLPSLKKFLFRGPLKWLLTPNVGDTTPLGRMLRFRDDLIAERIQNPEPYC